MLKFNSRGKPWKKPAEVWLQINDCWKIDFFLNWALSNLWGVKSGFFMILSWLLAFIFHHKYSFVEKGHTHFYIYIQSSFYFTYLYNTQSYFSFTMSEASRVIVYVFFRLNNIMTAIFAWNAFTDATGRDERDPILLAAAPPVAAISMTITASEL